MKLAGAKLIKISDFTNGKERLSIVFDTDVCKYVLFKDDVVLAESKFYDQLAKQYSEGSFKTTGDYNV